MVMNGTRVVGRGTNETIEQVNSATKEQARLKKACENFEAFLISYLLRQMWQAAESIGNEKPFMSQAYRDLFTFEFAQSLTPSLRLGIAEMLYRELSGVAFSDAPEIHLSESAAHEVLKNSSRE
jgi:flagellar protein FlgJ